MASHMMMANKDFLFFALRPRRAWRAWLLTTPTAPAALGDPAHWPRWNRTEVLCQHLDGNKGFFKILFIFLSKEIYFPMMRREGEYGVLSRFRFVLFFC